MSSHLENRAELYVQFFKTFWKLSNDRCRRYVGTDRPHGQAASFESLIMFRHLVLETKRQNFTVIDAGAGASSAILRSFFSNVITTDPDPDYLHQVELTCKELGLNSGMWITGVPEEPFEFCFYDYGAKERKPMLPLFLEKTRCLLYLDDAHDRDLLSYATLLCHEKHIPIALPIDASTDEFGRYGSAIYPCLKR